VHATGLKAVGVAMVQKVKYTVEYAYEKKYELAIKKTYKEDNKNLFKSRKDYGRCPVDFRPVDRQ